MSGLGAGSPDILIAGGGPAGSAAAIWAAEAGARVVLVERQSGPHDKVCGEFVSVEAGRSLRDLGVRPSRIGAVPVDRLRLICGHRSVETILPFAAESLSRRRLDEELLRIAGARGVCLHRGLAARTVAATPGGVRAALSDGSTLDAGALFLATGKHDLRGYRRGGGIQRGLIGFKMHLDLPAATARALAATVTLLLFPGGYAGLQPLAGTRANLCLLVQAARYEALGRSWTGLMQALSDDAPLWCEWLSGARCLWARPLSIAGLPYGYVAPTEAGPVFRLGDQMAVIPSFAGDGIAMALRSARLAVDAYKENNPQAKHYYRRAAREFSTRVRAAAWTSKALEEPWLQRCAAAGVRLMPGLLARAAVATRLGAG